MKATLILFFAVIAAPALAMRIGAFTTPSAPAKHVLLSAASGGVMNCVRLEAKQKYYMTQIQELNKEDIAIPAYLAGYASAAADSLEMLDCPLKGIPKA